MKPSKNPEVFGILENIGECRVINQVLDDPDFRANYYPVVADPTPVDLERNIVNRFNSQTKYPDSVNAQSSELYWNPYPKFEVLESDIKFVHAAARRVLATSNLAERLVNRLSGATKGAKAIIAYHREHASVARNSIKRLHQDAQ